MNESDSERIATRLETEGYQYANSFEEADLVVVNVCSIRQSAINRVYSKIQRIKNKRIVLTGCLLDKEKEKLKDYEIWPIADFSCRPKYQSPKKAFIPIMNGCNNFCSYCVVPYTRGRETFRPVKDIINEIRKLSDYEEIMLLGQNVNSYPNFPKLLETICTLGKFQIKFMTSHPKDMSDELIDVIAKNKRISREIHLPVQSGNDAILGKMNRKYTVKHYKKLVQKIQEKIPEVKLSTDIIVGFPGETEKQFQDTINLMKKIKFNHAYIASYSPRTQTQAFKLKDTVSSFEKKRRKKILLNMIK